MTAQVTISDDSSDLSQQNVLHDNGIILKRSLTGQSERDRYNDEDHEARFQCDNSLNSLLSIVPKIGQPVSLTCYMRDDHRDWEIDHNLQGERYVAFKLHVALSQWNPITESYHIVRQWTVLRRYRAFNEFHQSLTKIISNLPHFPGKTVKRHFEDKFLMVRQRALANFIKEVFSRRDILCTEEIDAFLEVNVKWKEFNSGADIQYPMALDSSRNPYLLERVTEPTYAMDHYALHARRQYLVTSSSDTSKLSQIDGLLSKAFKKFPNTWLTSDPPITGSRITVWIRSERNPYRFINIEEDTGNTGQSIKQMSPPMEDTETSITEYSNPKNYTPNFEVVWFDILPQRVTVMTHLEDQESVILGFENGAVLWFSLQSVVKPLDNQSWDEPYQRSNTRLVGNGTHRLAEDHGTSLSFTSQCDQVISIIYNQSINTILIVSKDGSMSFYELTADAYGKYVSVRDSWQTAIRSHVQCVAWDFANTGLIIAGYADSSLDVYQMSGRTAIICKEYLPNNDEPMTPARAQWLGGGYELLSPHRSGITCIKMVPGYVPKFDQQRNDNSVKRMERALDTTMVITGDRHGEVAIFSLSCRFEDNEKESRGIDDASTGLTNDENDDYDCAHCLGAKELMDIRDALDGSNGPSLPSSTMLQYNKPRIISESNELDCLNYHCDMKKQLLFRTSSRHPIISFAVDPHTYELFIGSRSRRTYVYDIRTGRPTFSMEGHDVTEHHGYGTPGAKVNNKLMGRGTGTTCIQVYNVYLNAKMKTKPDRQIWSCGRDGQLKAWSIPYFVRSEEYELRRRIKQRCLGKIEKAAQSRKFETQQIEVATENSNTTCCWLDNLSGIGALSYGIEHQLNWLDVRSDEYKNTESLTPTSSGLNQCLKIWISGSVHHNVMPNMPSSSSTTVHMSNN